MPQQAVTMETLPQAFEVVKEMQADGLDWGEGYRPLGRQALAGIIEGRMAETVDRWLDGLDGSAMRDRRNGTCRRCLLSELGDIELNVPRTRRFCPTEVLKSYARRAPEIDRAILAGFVPGLSTRKVGEVLLALPGRPVSAATVSRVARTLDLAVAAFHRRPLKNACKALMLDGVVLARKTGAGALRRPVLVALGIRHDGKKEIIDVQLAASESAAEWEHFLTALHRRGLTGEGLEMICVDGGQGLIAARPRVPHAASPIAGILSTPRPSPACATISTICSPASATRPSPSRSWSGPPTPSSDGSGRSADEPGPWEPSRTKPPWTASSTPSSSTKTNPRESVHHSH